MDSRSGKAITSIHEHFANEHRNQQNFYLDITDVSEEEIEHLLECIFLNGWYSTILPSDGISRINQKVLMVSEKQTESGDCAKY